MIAADGRPDDARRAGEAKRRRRAAPDAGDGVGDRLGPLGAAARAGGETVARAGGGALGAGRAVAGRGARRVAAARAETRSAPTSTTATPTTSARTCRSPGSLATLWYRGRGPQHGQRARGRARAAGRQPHRRQHGAGSDRLPLAFSTYFGVERPFYQLAHNLVLASPLGPFLRRYGADGRLARARAKALALGRRGARLPRRRLGGPPAELGGQQGRFRRPQGVHPAGARRGRADRPGGHDRRPGDRAVPQPRRLAREADPASTATCGSRCCRSRSRSPGVSTSATCSATFRCRRRSRSRCCAPIDLERAVRPRARPRRGLRPRHPGDAGGARRPRRRAPLPGDRLMRAQRVDRRRGAAEADLGLHRRPGEHAPLHVRRDPLGGRRRATQRARRPLPDADQGRLGRGRRPDRGRRVERAARHGLVVGDRRRPARPLASARGRRWTGQGRAAVRLRRRRRRESSATSPSASPRPRWAATCGARCSSSSARSSTSGCAQEAARRRAEREASAA